MRARGHSSSRPFRGLVGLPHPARELALRCALPCDSNPCFSGRPARRHSARTAHRLTHKHFNPRTASRKKHEVWCEGFIRREPAVTQVRAVAIGTWLQPDAECRAPPSTFAGEAAGSCSPSPFSAAAACRTEVPRPSAGSPAPATRACMSAFSSAPQPSPPAPNLRGTHIDIDRHDAVATADHGVRVVVVPLRE